MTTEELLDGFAAEVRRQLAEAIEDGAEGEELRSTIVIGVKTLLTCHWCGAAGLPPCACGEDDPSWVCDKFAEPFTCLNRDLPEADWCDQCRERG